MIHRVRVSQLLPDLSTRLVLVFRIGGTQQDAEDFGHRVQTRWMELNPGYATLMRVDWPTSEELGEHHVMPPTPDFTVGC